MRTDDFVPSGALVLTGMSGGPDSTVLLHVLARLRTKLRFELVACGVDHGLRPEAQAELALARSVAETLSIRFEAERVCVVPGSNLMKRARDARYAALRQVASRVGATRIAVGHHAEDRAETVLMRLLRGSGPAGLAVMPPRAGDLIRPLIRARRADIEAYIARHTLPVARDPTNLDGRFLRCRVREHLLPLLRELSPRIVEHLCDLADDMAAIGLSPSGEISRRCHWEQLAAAAMRCRGSVRVALPAGRVARFDPVSGRVVVEETDRGGARRRARSD